MRRAMCCMIVVWALLRIQAAGADELVVVVNAASGINRLSREQVINIFLGRYRRYPSGLAAEPIDQPDGSAARERFYRVLVGKEVAEIDAYWARLIFSGRTSPPLRARRSGEELRLLAARAGGIAYVERSTVTPRMTIVLSLGNDR